MKNLLKITFCLLLISACGGNKDNLSEEVLPEPEKELGSFNLIFPDNNLICTEGESVNDNQVTINFMWGKSNNATSYTLAVKNLDTEEIVSTSSTTLSKSVTLPKNTQFSWAVTAILGNKNKKSNSWNFYSEGIPVANFAPFPAEITITDNLDSTAKIDWLSSDLDNDIKDYNVYFGTQPEPAILLEEVTTNSIAAQPISYDTNYYIKIVTKDLGGNTATNRKQFKFEN